MSGQTKYVTVGQAAERLTVPIVTIWRWRQEGCFPDPVKPGPRRPLARRRRRGLGSRATTMDTRDL